MTTTTALPVITEAYRRFVCPPEDTYRISNEPQREIAGQFAAKAEYMALQSGANSSTSGTLLSQDLIHAISSQNLGTLFISVENQTNNVVFEAVKENLEQFWLLLDKTNAETLIGNTPAATNLFSATQYCATADSATTKQPLEDRYTWLKVVYELVRQQQTSKALRVIYASVENHFKRSELIDLSEILANVDLSRLSPQTMTALLRISGRAMRALPSWHVLLQRTRNELIRLNVPDLTGLMVGLEG